MFITSTSFLPQYQAIPANAQIIGIFATIPCPQCSEEIRVQILGSRHIYNTDPAKIQIVFDVVNTEQPHKLPFSVTRDQVTNVKVFATFVTTD